MNNNRGWPKNQRRRDEQTDPGDISKIRAAVEEKREACLCLLNYKKDGSTFHNQFFLTPLFDASGKLVSSLWLVLFVFCTVFVSFLLFAKSPTAVGPSVRGLQSLKWETPNFPPGLQS